MMRQVQFREPLSLNTSNAIGVEQKQLVELVLFETINILSK